MKLAQRQIYVHYRMILFPITKMIELLLLSHDHVCNRMCIKPVGHGKKLPSKSVCKLRVYSKNHGVRTLFQEDNIFGTNASLTYGYQTQIHTCV